MSAFEGTPFNLALRDCGIDAFAIVGIAMEIGIEPTVRHGADLGYIPVVVKDACGFGHRDAAERSIAILEFAGDALLTNVETICAQFRRILATDGGPRVTEGFVPACARPRSTKAQCHAQESAVQSATAIRSMEIISCVLIIRACGLACCHALSAQFSKNLGHSGSSRCMIGAGTQEYAESKLRLQINTMYCSIRNRV